MNIRSSQPLPRAAGFTMVEIAICLAVVGFALVAILRVLPLGLNVQRDNRQETLINQDATVFIESIRNGLQSGFDLTNYVFGISNYWTLYGPDQTPQFSRADYYTFTGSYFGATASPFALTNNARIVGLMSTPEFCLNLQNGLMLPTNNLLSGGIGNHLYVYVRSLSGTAVEKPPQDNEILRQDSFAYRIVCVNAPVAQPTNNFGLDQQAYNRQLAANLHELRLTFAWPLRPNLKVSQDGPPAQTQRTMVAGTIQSTFDNGVNLFYYQSQTFTNNP
jgi:type II secretory pathway pseudopilin PulG